MKPFKLELISPEEEDHLEILFLSLEDRLGSLGIYANHDSFLTVLTRSVGHFLDLKGEKRFIAYDFGLLKLRDNKVSLITRTFVVGSSTEEIEEELRRRVERIERAEGKIRKSLEELERAILKRLAEIERSL